ncbi:MAG: hypothetical protein L3K14_01325 [Thermoplasmata archaeon]|nr:hypothetical protein [Thermoplasmata archaeon]
MATHQEGFLTRAASPLPIDLGLLERFLEAEHRVEWRPVDPPPISATSRRKPRVARSGAMARSVIGARLAYYHDETARIEHRSVGSADVLTVTSGPVGALVIVGECHRRGLPTRLAARIAGDVPEFPEGAIEARWDANARAKRYAIPFADVVNLARYALT